MHHDCEGTIETVEGVVKLTDGTEFKNVEGLGKLGNGLLGMVSTFCAAQIAVLCSVFFTYPFDTVRRRLQMEADLPLDQRLYDGALHCVQKIIEDEGVGGLFAGAYANAIRTVAAAVALVLYDRCKQAMELM